MKKGKEKGLTKLFKIAYLIALRGRLCTNFSNLMELEGLHGEKFLEKYKNQVACQDFISDTGDYFFTLLFKSKLEHANFIGIWNDRTNDAATIGQEVLYVTFLDPDTFQPCSAFLKVAELESQDAQGSKDVIILLKNQFRESPIENSFSCI